MLLTPPYRLSKELALLRALLLRGLLLFCLLFRHCYPLLGVYLRRLTANELTQ
jgi:hypothetical protein